MRRRAVVLLVGLVLVSDAVVIALAAWNRAGAPECVLTLTERELALPPFAEAESTGVTLTLELGDLPWFKVRRVADRHGAPRRGPSYPWLDSAKLASLGFGARPAAADARAMEWYARAVRPAFAVLEMDGAGYAAVVAARERELEEARAELAEGRTDRGRVEGLAKLLEIDGSMCSRLIAVDAGRDAGALRSRYPDRARYAVAPALVRLVVDRPADGQPRVGALVEVLVGEVDVPLRLRSRLAPFLPKETAERVLERERALGEKPPWPAAVPPRYTVKLAFGRHYEPWIVDITPLTTDH
jgi:hypothetical protein